MTPGTFKEYWEANKGIIEAGIRIPEGLIEACKYWLKRFWDDGYKVGYAEAKAFYKTGRR